MHNNSFDRFKAYKQDLYENREPCSPAGDVHLLQFINTKRFRNSAQVKDYLKNYLDFVMWAWYDVGLIDKHVFETLFFEGYCFEVEAAEVFSKVTGIRDSLYEAVICCLKGIPVYEHEFARLNLANDEADKHLGIAMTASGPREVWLNVEEELGFPLWKLAKIAGSFIVSEELKNVKICSCGNLFLDKTKGKNRYWCSKSCGMAYWSRKYYERRKAGQFIDLKIEVAVANPSD